MRAIVFLEEHFLKDENGIFHSMTFDDEFWMRYLNVFDSVTVVARVRLCATGGISPACRPIRDPRVVFYGLPDYQGAREFLGVFLRIVFNIWRATGLKGVSVLRLPGVIGGVASVFLLGRRKKFGVELVGDPAAVFGSGEVGGRFARLYGLIFTAVTRLACARAAAVAYVTRCTMQRTYPPGPNSYTTHYSSISLEKEQVATARNVYSVHEVPGFQVLLVGSLAQRYKGFDLMIRAMALLRSRGFGMSLRIIGDGACREELEGQVRDLGLGEVVTFSGALPREAVLTAMDAANLFVIPSRTEGLPRVLIEAMARGLPAIGSNVGGIPELLSGEYLFAPEDFCGIADMVQRVSSDKGLLERMSQEGIASASEFIIENLQERRDRMFSHLCSGVAGL